MMYRSLWTFLISRLLYRIFSYTLSTVLGIFLVYSRILPLVTLTLFCMSSKARWTYRYVRLGTWITLFNRSSCSSDRSCSFALMFLTLLFMRMLISRKVSLSSASPSLLRWIVGKRSFRDWKSRWIDLLREKSIVLHDSRYRIQHKALAALF